jgi:hypothetical protein
MIRYPLQVFFEKICFLLFFSVIAGDCEKVDSLYIGDVLEMCPYIFFEIA